METAYFKAGKMLKATACFMQIFLKFMIIFQLSPAGLGKDIIYIH